MHSLRRMSDLAAAGENLMPVAALPLYPRLLGRSFAALLGPVRALYFITGVRAARGLAVLRPSTGLLARLLRLLLGMPLSVGEMGLSLRVEPWRGAERWQLCFGTHAVAIEQRPLPYGLLGERWRLVELRARVLVEDRALQLRPAGAALRLGPLSLPLPLGLAPQLTAEVRGSDSSLHLRWAVRAPLLGLICSYEAELGVDDGARGKSSHGEK
ncbi:MAG: DUF4166 domain-containing protein [Myxococcales bacterium]|nr:DUF4166 domain-containing protein [Myxococcota bacterium]MDW8283062.1 DUF4166 domain-containing protein [Myxococcales bacterium]